MPSGAAVEGIVSNRGGYGLRQSSQLFRVNNVGRHQINKPPKGPDPHAAVNEKALYFRQIDILLHFHYANSAKHSNLLNKLARCQGSELPLHLRFNLRYLILPVVFRKQIKARTGNGAG